MLLDRYAQDQLLCNTNLKEQSGSFLAYRGDLVLTPGEVADAQGRRKPPLAVVRDAVMLVDGAQIKLVSGFIDELALLKEFTPRYQADLAEGAIVLFFTPNIAKPMRVVEGGHSYIVIPLLEGMVWNELLEELRLEKGDFKGQSAAEKVLTLYHAFQDYQPKYDSLSLDEALTRTIVVKRELRGAV